MQRFDGRVAVITGGASGIGAASARRLADEGARVLIADINEEGGAAVAKEIGERAAFRRTNVCDEGEVAALVAEALERFGRLDVLFNNAGAALAGQTPDLDPQGWRDLFTLDVHSIFYGCRAAIPVMRERGGGSIINTASISGLGGDSGLAAYNAAKGAVVNYTRTLAIDHARDGIRANAVCPGYVETDLTRQTVARIVERTGRTEVEARAFLAESSGGRILEPDEVAEVVVELCSSTGSDINGVARPLPEGIV